MPKNRSDSTTDRAGLNRWAHWAADSSNTPREERLAQASRAVGRDVSSYNDLGTKEILEVIRDAEQRRGTWPA